MTSSPVEWSLTFIVSLVDVDTISLDEQLHTIGVICCNSPVEWSATILVG
jgi:hypothetical protein